MAAPYRAKKKKKGRLGFSSDDGKLLQAIIINAHDGSIPGL